MSSIPQQRLDRLIERWHTLQAALNAGPSAADFAKFSKEFSELDPVVSAIEALRRAECRRPRNGGNG
jgi:peptide chain release factor 1